ncbi:MAG: hypothetical protein FJY83_01390 [Candidatus Aminicenantes bacterium]|nr:hypothetical protein [Candidatus Aminicenantes bacterium]
MAIICVKCRHENSDETRFCGSCAAPLTSGGTEPAASYTRTMEMPAAALKSDAVIAGKYRIVEEIGRGGMGVVYKAEDLKLKRSVALKFLPPHLADSPDLKERFLIEAQAAAALNHPNICTIHEVGESEERPYIAMEYVEGETLRDRLRKGPLKAEEALDIAAQVAAGLGEAHQKGIIHRDIKSANIMVTPRGRAKVMDFGLAKLRGGSSLTRTQTTIGTVAYMSPEQARGGELDGRTDIWSLGVVLFEMLTGRLPFRGDHDQTMIRSILHDEPETMRKACPGVKPELERVAGQALVKNPARRYQTMEDFLGDLKAVAEGLMPLKARRRIRKNIFGLSPAVFFPVAAAALVLVLLGLNVLGLRDRVFGGKDGAEPGIRLAVLPFANLTGDPEQEYLNDGLTQEMITLLGGLHPQSLSVIARTSVMRYKKGDTPIDRIGRELGVEYVLEGSARRKGSRIRITAELIKVKDQTQLWADVFEREMSGILALQNDVAQKVVKALALKLLPAEQARLAGAPIVNAEAYDAVLKGGYHWRKLTAPEFDTAQRYFELALSKDPSYAPAYAGLAAVWAGRQQMGIMSAREAAPHWKEAALQAVALDENSAEAHDVLAGYLTWHEWDWAGAEPEWRKSIELNPNNATNQAYYSHFLAITGSLDEAVIHSDLAVILDPFNELILGLHAQVLNFAGRYEEAVAAARKALSLQPDSPIALDCIYHVSNVTGRYDQAFEAIKLLYSKELADLDHVFNRFGELGYAGTLSLEADTLLAQAGSRYIAPTYIYDLYAFAGNKERALDMMENAYEVRDPNVLYIGKPSYSILREEPRYRALLRKLKIPIGDKK